jgi:hypothetical protein
MTTSNTKLNYYDGWWWRTTLLPDGTRAVQPARIGGGPTARATNALLPLARPGPQLSFRDQT